MFPGGDGNVRIEQNQRSDKGEDITGKMIPGAKKTVLPLPFPEVSQAEWDKIVLTEAL